MKILITGGHHTCALVVAKRFLKAGHQVVWVGHKYSMMNVKNTSAEYQDVMDQKIPFIDIKAGKFQVKHKFLQNLYRIPQGIIQAVRVLKKEKPDLIISFGGYIAVPVALGSFVLGIPLVTHEQTTVSGLANFLVSKVAKKVFVSFADSGKYFPEEKTILSGLPVRQELFDKSEVKFKDFEPENKFKTIYITGGKQGSHIINETVYKILPELLDNFNIIHQTGSTTIFSDFQKALTIKKTLGKKAEKYLAKEYFFENEIGFIMNKADFLVTRAGANIVYELILLKKPAILIPIPWSNRNEQVKNAQLFSDLGLGEILNQDKLEGKELLKTIVDFSQKTKNYSLNKSFNVPKNKPEDIIFDESIKILKER